MEGTLIIVIFINNIIVYHMILSSYIGIYRNHLHIFSYGVRRLCVLWVYIQTALRAIE
jgi:hypothetical protein